MRLKKKTPVKGGYIEMIPFLNIWKVWARDEKGDTVGSTTFLGRSVKKINRKLKKTSAQSLFDSLVEEEKAYEGRYGSYKEKR